MAYDGVTSDTMILAAHLVAMVAGGATGEPGWAVSVPLPVAVASGAAPPSRPGAETGHPEANERDLAPAARHDQQ